MLLLHSQTWHQSVILMRSVLVLMVPARSLTWRLLLNVGRVLAAGKKLGTVVVSSMEEARALMDWHALEQDQHSGHPLRIWPLDNLRHSCPASSSSVPSGHCQKVHVAAL